MIVLGTGRDGSRHLLRAQRPDEARTLSRELSLPPVLARLLASRGVTEVSRASELLLGEAARTHEPFAMTGMREAVTRLLGAARDGARVAVVGDDDLDGVAGAVLLAEVLAEAGAVPVTVFVERRSGRPDPSFLRTVVERERTAGVVTVDGAASEPPAASAAVAAGAWVVLTDHHGALAAPPGVLLLDPSRPECAYPFKGLSGAGVAWKLAAAVAASLPAGPRAAAQERLERSTALVALATLSDLSPLTDENRVLVARGLAVLSARPGPGLAALLALAGLGSGRRVTARQAVFRLVPRLNAAARLGRPALAAALLSEESPAGAARLAADVETMNSERRLARERVLSDVRSRLRSDGRAGPDALVVESGREATGWRCGVLGSAALALAQEVRRPVLLFCEGDDGLLRGSGRGFGRMPLKSRLADVARAFALSFGGHEGAVGLVLPAAAYGPFRDGARSAFAAGQGLDAFRPALVADTEIHASDVEPSLPARLAPLGPHGPSNPRPLFLLRNVVPAGRPRSLGPRGTSLTVEVAGRRLLTEGRNLRELLTLGDGRGPWDLLVRVGSAPREGGPVLSIVGLSEAA